MKLIYSEFEIKKYDYRTAWVYQSELLFKYESDRCIYHFGAVQKPECNALIIEGLISDKEGSHTRRRCVVEIDVNNVRLSDLIPVETDEAYSIIEWDEPKLEA